MTNPPATVIKNPTWWRRRTHLERNLTVLAGCTILASLFLALALSTLYFNHGCNMENLPSITPENNALIGKARGRSLFQTREQEKDNICLTPGCVKAASAVINNMDPSVDPCDDFYEFSCGNFIKETIIDDDKTSHTTFSAISDSLLNKLRLIVTEPIKNNEPKPFRMAKLLYKSCMDKDKIEKQGLGPIKNMLKSLGGWPVLEGDSWNGSGFTWKDSVYKFRTAGYSVDYFIDFSISTDLKNTTSRAIDLDQASLGLSREYLVKGLDEKIVAAYYRYMVDIAVLFGADRQRATRELRESLDFEIGLAKISLPLEERRDAAKLYNPMYISTLQQRFPSIPWNEYMNTLLRPLSIRDNDIIIVNSPRYLTDLEAILSTTPKRIQANYVLWRAAAASVSYLTEELRKRQLDYSTELSGRTEREPRWKECVDISSGSFSLAIGSLYVRRFFHEDAKKNALEMVTGIREEMLKILSTIEWMDENTRKNALDKAKSMTSHIAYPDELLDDKKLVEFYGDLDITDEDYYTSVLNLTKFGTDYSFSRLRQPVNKSDWITHSRTAIVNAFYSAIENSIQFPAGILQGAFFSSDRPRYMNYGAIGFVIGHEITHGFDDQGRQFDKEGNLVDWWAEETKKRYLEKASCIIKQYGNYTAEEVGLKLNGINTQGENIADNGGVKEAYYAYNVWTKRHGIEPRLPGLQDYTPQQMFWISAANVWCSKYRPETLKNRITTGFHSPGRFRIIGPFSNLEDFAHDFKCPLGTKMNPVNKCQVW
ncbi:neprilysin-2 isoform X2 [Adelges cooleyi]|uniref:neprilysin-2 isoform X2 n=1 Tax=Adelges cooleyi TaxID=133065 RepID=UPI0021801609|nr:neprilysin-2 isoform X2 [Adelges cooleyi]